MDMREIKFRAWNSYARKMVQDRDTHKPDYAIAMTGALLQKDDNGACGDPECCGSYEEYMTAANAKQYHLMQYTGLHDKNGKEIYEGDLLKWMYADELLRVEWRGAGWALFSKLFSSFGLPDGHYCASHQSGGYARNSEVIGNIHENPDLLGKPAPEGQDG